MNKKAVPVGVENFERIIKDGYYYVGSYPYNMSADYTKLTKEIISKGLIEAVLEKEPLKSCPL